MAIIGQIMHVKIIKASKSAQQETLVTLSVRISRGLNHQKIS